MSLERFGQRSERSALIRSDGRHIRDYFHVEDGAGAYTTLVEALAKRPELAGEAFNFSNDLQVFVLNLVRRILEGTNPTLEPDVRNQVSNEIRHQSLSAAKGRGVLGWQPLYALDEGINRANRGTVSFWQHE